jgi:DNA-binding NarL/FixJ family response regulator
MDRALRLDEQLNSKKMRVVSLVADGLTNAEIARQLGRSKAGIQDSLKVIFELTEIASRLELALRYWEENPEYLLGKRVAALQKMYA